MQDLSQKDGEELIEALPVTKKTKKTRKRLSYNPKFIKMVSRLAAAGHNSTDIAFLIGVKKATIEQWKHRYPVFKKAWEDGRKIAGSSLIVTGLKACEGYEVEEETIKYTWNTLTECWENSEKKVIKKQVLPNPSLIQFFLGKLCPEIFGQERELPSVPTKAEAIATDIQKLAGKLTQYAGSVSEPIDTEFEDPESQEDNEE